MSILDFVNWWGPLGSFSCEGCDCLLEFFYLMFR